MRVKILLLIQTQIFSNFVFGDYEHTTEFFSEEQVYEDDVIELDFTSPVYTKTSIPSVHTDPRNISVNQLFSPEFTEGHVVVPILEVESDETEGETDLIDDETEIEIIVNDETDDFNHTKENWSEILSIEPKFTESENVAENINNDQNPEFQDQTDTIDQNNKNDEESPSDDVVKDVVNPIFTENEFVPERIFDGEVGSVPTEQKKVKNDENITDYKNPNSKYEKTKQDNPILEDDTEPEKISLEIPKTSESFVIKDWESKIDLGHNWYELEWFGIFYTTGNDFKGTGWIYHLELGWVFISSKNYESVWIWLEQLGGWKWTSETTFPYLFLNNTGSWLFFNKEKKLFYNFAQDKWVDTSIK